LALVLVALKRAKTRNKNEEEDVGAENDNDAYGVQAHYFQDGSAGNWEEEVLAVDGCNERRCNHNEYETAARGRGVGEWGVRGEGA
jgi:hypothetical protein